MIEAKTLNRVLGRVLHAVSSDDTRPQLAACHLYVHEEGAIYAFATDGHRAARVTRGDVRALLDVVDQHARAYTRTDWMPLPAGWTYCPLPTRAAVLDVRRSCRSYSNHAGDFSTQDYAIAAGFAPSEEREIQTTVFQIAGHRSRFIWPIGLTPQAHLRVIGRYHTPTQELVIERVLFENTLMLPSSDPSSLRPAVLFKGSAETGLHLQGTWIGAPWSPQSEFSFGADRAYVLDALAACKLAPLKELRGNVRVQLGGPLDPIMFVENAAEEMETPEGESFVACVMPIRS
jgi:hypothetical protein